jgi:hypothetical protein
MIMSSSSGPPTKKLRQSVLSFAINRSTVITTSSAGAKHSDLNVFCDTIITKFGSSASLPLYQAVGLPGWPRVTASSFKLPTVGLYTYIV